MVEIFCTNVEDPEVAAHIVNELTLACPGIHFNFDLEDCDRILRAAGQHLPSVMTKIKAIALKNGITIVQLE